MAINTMLNIMERMLGYTPEETGGRSTRDESATAVSARENSRGVRLSYTGGFIDEARHARKNQLYEAMMNYSDDQIMAEVAELNEAKESELKSMGFEVEYPAKGEHTKAGVKGKKASLKLDGFATERDISSQTPDSQLAASMIQTFQVIFSNPQMVEQMGVPQLIDLFNQMLYYAGLPKDFRLKLDATKKSPLQEQGEQIQAVQQQLAQALEAVKVEAAESDAKVVQGVQQEMQQLAQATQQMVQKEVGELAQATQQMVQGEVGQLAEGIKQSVAGPMNEHVQQMGQAMVQLIQRLQTGEQKDLAQDEAISKLISIFSAASGIPDGAPPPVVEQPPVPVGI